MTANSANRPVETFRARGIEVAVWAHEVERDGRTFTRHSVTLRKSYYDRGAGEYRETSTLFVDDLPRAQLVLAKAYEYILTRASNSDDGNCDA